MKKKTAARSRKNNAGKTAARKKPTRKSTAKRKKPAQVGGKKKNAKRKTLDLSKTPPSRLPVWYKRQLVQQAMDDSNPQESGSPESKNVDAIRDIIFGQQMRDYETRFGKLEASLRREAQEVRDDLKRRLDSIEKYARNEIDALRKELQSEKTDRVAGHKDLTRSQRNHEESFGDRLGALDETIQNSARDLRQLILDETKKLNDELDRKSDESAQTMHQGFDELREGKTDRMALAELLSDLAMRLKGDSGADNE